MVRDVPLQLDSLTFRGYKAFPGGDIEDGDFQRLTLAPLTIIFGKNNSGKSAVVRLPRLLLGGLSCSDERILPLEVRGLRYGGKFVDIIHGGDFFRRLGFGIQARHGSDRLDLVVELYSSGALASDKPPQIWSYRMESPKKIELPSPTDRHAGMRFRGLLPSGSGWDSWREAASNLLDDMIHLGPVRKDIDPAYVEEEPEKLGLNGQQAPQWLRAEPELMDAVGSWFERNMDGWRLSLSRSNETFGLRVGMSRAMATNLAQAGQGLQQVLPIVVHQLWRQLQSKSEIFLDVVEQPELHLHAAAQAPLADLFIDTTLKGRGMLLVETHAKPILLRIQRRVAEGLLPHDHVALYYVEVTAGGSKLRSVGLQPSGEVDWWPDGVFEEDFQEVAAMSRAQRRRAVSGEQV